MGQKNAAEIKRPEIELTYASKVLNLYTVPKTFEELEAIAYNFYYSIEETILPYEYLNLKYHTRGFNKRTLFIFNKSSYKCALKRGSKETLQIEIIQKGNERLLNFRLKKIDSDEVNQLTNKIKAELCENSEVFSEVFLNYSKMIQISNHFSQYILAHNTKSSLVAIFGILLSDPFKSIFSEKYTVLDTWPYIKLNSEALSESSSNTLRIWNDFVYYLEKALSIGTRVYSEIEDLGGIVKRMMTSSELRDRYRSSYDKVLKTLNTLKILKRRLDEMHEQVKDFSIFVRKEQTVSQLNCIASIISSCGSYGSENFNMIFGITPIHKFYLD